VSPSYDTIRAGTAEDFDAGGFCVEWDDGSDTQASDTAIPDAGDVLYYLIRAENACGPGSLGWESVGAERSACTCP
jgi:hypothetical protein